MRGSRGRTPLRLGIYSRISDDRKEDLLGVQRQIEDGEEEARKRYPNAELVLYVDNDVSAYDRRKKRPAFLRMVDDLKFKHLDGIVVYDLDRLARQPRDLELVIDVYEDRKKDRDGKGPVFITVTADYDLATSDGRTHARIMVTMANKASADTGRRTARKHLELARQGKPVGGWRPFGWQKDKATLNKREAEAMRKVIKDVIAGKSTRSCTYWLNDNGFKTTGGKAWSFQTLRRYLRNPRLVGWRVHQKKVLLDKQTGEPVKGLWEPLIDLDTWERLQVALDDRYNSAKKGRTARRNARFYLLTGIVKCGVCNSAMYGSKQPNDRFNYVCGNGDYNGHSNAISGRTLDYGIEQMMLRVAAEEPLDAQPDEEWYGEQELAQAKEDLQDVMARALQAQGAMRNILYAQAEELGNKVDEMQNDRAQWISETTGPVISALTPEVWETLDIDQKREAIADRMEAVLIKPATRRLPSGIDWERVVPVWRR